MCFLQKKPQNTDNKVKIPNRERVSLWGRLSHDEEQERGEYEFVGMCFMSYFSHFYTNQVYLYH